MGQWMRDGSYQYDESDIAVREAMNETQGQYYDRIHRHDRTEKSWLERHNEEVRREREYAQRVEERAETYSRINAARDEEERKRELEQQRKEQRREYENAKARFNRLSPIKKIWLNLTGKGINAYSPNNDVETLKSAFGGKTR